MTGSAKAKIALLTCSLLFTVFAMEVGLRLLKPTAASDSTIGSGWNEDGDSHLHIRSANAERIYELRPNAEVLVDEHETVYRTNSLGFRDRERQIPKPDDVFRILVIGDSITFGWRVELDEIYPYRLERLFLEEGKKVEVISIAVGGYDTLQEAAMFKDEGLAFDPDLLVIGYCLNDNQLAVDDGLRTHFTKSPSMVWNAVRRVGQELHAKVRSIPDRGFEQIRELCQERDIPVVTMIFPILDDTEEDYPYADAHATVAGLAEASGFEVLDLYSKYTELGRDKLALDSYHPNSEGHRIAATELFTALRDRVSH